MLRWITRASTEAPLSQGQMCWLACDDGLTADQIYLTPNDPTVGAGLLAKAAWQSTQLERVYPLLR